MSRYIFQQSIAATLGVAIVSTGILTSLNSYAQGGTTTAPASTTAPSGTTAPPSGTMTKPTVPSGQTPPDTMSKPTTKPATPTATKTIVELATSNKSFTTLVKALKAADLVETLSGAGPFTVFAPTDAAFAKLPKATLAKLLKPENKEQLKKILTYHVVPSVVTSQMLKAGQIDTVEGGKITVKVRKGNKAPIVTLNNSATIKAGAKATNGIIYAIDTVIMPPTK
jgi:uncharacterized surface protein with fasciclin (FAS1) repeats